MCGVRQTLPDGYKMSLVQEFISSKLPQIHLTPSQLAGVVQFLDSSLPGWEALIAIMPFLEIFIHLVMMIERGHIPQYQQPVVSEKPIQVIEQQPTLPWANVLGEIFQIEV